MPFLDDIGFEPSAVGDERADLLAATNREIFENLSKGKQSFAPEGKMPESVQMPFDIAPRASEARVGGVASGVPPVVSGPATLGMGEGGDWLGGGLGFGGAGTAVSAQEASSGASNLARAAAANVGKLSTAHMAGTAGGSLGCAGGVCSIVHDQLGLHIDPTLSTDTLYAELVASGWRRVDPSTPGAIIISPTRGAQHGHTGIVGYDGKIYSNDSRTGNWEQNYSVGGWERYFGSKGLETYAFLPPVGSEGNIPAYASGGIVWEPTVALVGEKGPEAIVPIAESENQYSVPPGRFSSLPGETGTQRFWRETLTQVPMPPGPEEPDPTPALPIRVPGTLDLMPRARVAPGTDPGIMREERTLGVDKILTGLQRVVDSAYATTASEGRHI